MWAGTLLHRYWRKVDKLSLLIIGLIKNDPLHVQEGRFLL